MVLDRGLAGAIKGSDIVLAVRKKQSTDMQGDRTGMGPDCRAVLGHEGHFSEAVYVGTADGGTATWAMQRLQFWQASTKDNQGMEQEVVGEGNEFCFGFFQTANRRFLREQSFGDQDDNRQVVPVAVVMSASDKIAERMQNNYTTMEQCVNKSGQMTVVGFMPLEVLLKWATVDPTREGKLNKSHPDAKDLKIYKYQQLFLIQLARNFQDSDWMVMPNAMQHQFNKGVASSALNQPSIKMFENAYALKTKPGETKLSSAKAWSHNPSEIVGVKEKNKSTSCELRLTCCPVLTF